MTKEINLLANRKKSSSENKKIAIILRVISVVSLLIIGFSSISLFFLKSKMASSSLVKEERFILSNLTLFNDKALKQLLVQKRINDTSNLLEKRINFYETIDILTKKVPEKVVINSISVEKKKIVMSFSSSSLSAIDLLLSNLTNTKINNNNFKKVNLSGIFRDAKSGQYLFSVDLDLL